MLQILPFSGMSMAQGSLLQQQFGLIQQQQSLQPVVFQPVQQQQSSNLPVVIPPLPPTPTPDLSYVFTQTSVSPVWTINHNLGTFPSVTIVDPSGNQVFAQVQYINSNQVVVTFSQPFAGSAYLSA